MVLCKLVRRHYDVKLPVSIKYQNLHSFKEGWILLCQSILETRRITHLHDSTLFTIPLNIPLIHPILTQGLIEMILLSTSWRIFLFQSTNSSIITLGLVETICSMPESKPISIFLLHLFQFIDIASQKLGPLLTSFFNLEFVSILRSPVKTWPWCSLTKSLCSWQTHALMSVSYVVSPFVSMEDTVSFNLKCYFFCFATGSSNFNLSGKRLFTISKWSIEYWFM